jgi:hypothetical protein
MFPELSHVLELDQVRPFSIVLEISNSKFFSGNHSIAGNTNLCRELKRMYVCRT